MAKISELLKRSNSGVTFSFKTISDQRDGYSIGFDGKMLNQGDQFFFLESGNEFESDFHNFKLLITKNMDFVFEKFSSIKDLYDYLISPILKGKVSLPNVGAD